MLHHSCDRLCSEMYGENYDMLSAHHKDTIAICIYHTLVRRLSPNGALTIGLEKVNSVQEMLSGLTQNFAANSPEENISSGALEAAFETS